VKDTLLDKLHQKPFWKLASDFAALNHQYFFDKFWIDAPLATKPEGKEMFI
jgi:hypothetical protein